MVVEVININYEATCRTVEIGLGHNLKLCVVSVSVISGNNLTGVSSDSFANMKSLVTL